MQATHRTKKTPQRSRKNPKQKQRQKSIRVIKARKENYTSRSSSRFYPIVPKGFFQLDVVETHDHDYDLMFDNLKPSYLKYCELSGVGSNEFSGIPTKDVRMMTAHLKSILHSQYKNARLRIQEVDTGYQFEVYSHIEAARSDTVYIFSMMLFERINFMSKYFSEVFEKFMASMFNKMHINYYVDNYRFEAILMEIDQRENYEDGEEGERQWQSDMACYLKFAPLYVKRMRKVGDQFVNTKFKSHINELSTHRYTELDALREWMLIGYDILSDSEFQDIYSFQYDNEIRKEYTDDDAPEDAVKLNDTFVVSWDNDDGITNQFIEWLNGDSGEYGSFSPCEWMILSPNTSKIYKHSEWGERYFRWLNDGFSIFNQFDKR